MNKTKSLASQVIGAAAIATLIGTSAFAETRHSDATERDQRDHSRQSDHRGSRDGNRQSNEQRDNRGSDTRTFERHDSGTTAPRTFEHRDSRNDRQNYDRGNTQFDRRTQADTYRDRGGYDRSQSNRGGYDRSQSNRGGYDRSQSNRGGYDRSQSYRGGYDRSQSYRSNRPSFDDRGRRNDSIHGRVNRFEHERGGYRVWVDGGLYPIWIPEARISLFPHLRVGLSLGFGGYYDPRGYLEAYDYYDSGYYGGGYYGAGSSAYSSGLLRGTVESIDYLRDHAHPRPPSGVAAPRRLRRDFRRLDTQRCLRRPSPRGRTGWPVLIGSALMLWKAARGWAAFFLPAANAIIRPWRDLESL
jgi:hypothetical protein